MDDFLHDPDKDIRKRAVEVLGLAADPKSPNLDRTINTLLSARRRTAIRPYAPPPSTRWARPRTRASFSR